MKHLLTLFLLFFFISVSLTQAQIPQTINYQGVLTDNSGQVVADDNYALTFRLYDASSGGTTLWVESRIVPVEKGLFNVILGEVVPINLPFDNQYWLGIAINAGSELEPRTKLTSVAYSLNTKKLQGRLVSEQAPAIDQVLKWDGAQWKPSADATAQGTGVGNITKVTAGNGLTGGGETGDVTLNVGAGDGITVWDDSVALNKTYADGRYVNERQANSITANMIMPNIISSVDGITNDGGNIDLVGGNNITITPNNTAKTITIDATNGSGDNLGNHTATQNIKLGNHWLSGDGDNEGVFVSSAGNVGIGTQTLTTGRLVVAGLVHAGGTSGDAFRIGDDARLVDINSANTIGIFGIQDSSIAHLKLGQNGPKISGWENNLGIGTTIPTRKLWVNGDAGGVTGWFNDSDERLKKNIRTLEKPLERVLKLRGVNFEWKDQENYSKGIQMGFIAQEVKNIIPEVVDKKGEYYSMQYAPITALLVEAIKEQQEMINQLTQRITEFEKRLTFGYKE